LRNPLPDLFALLFAGIFLFVLVEQEEQVNVAARLQVQVQITVAAALALAAARICYARLADATQARNHRAAFGIALKVSLNRSQHTVSAVAGKPMKFPRERQGFDELHIVIVPQCGIWWQGIRLILARGRGGRRGRKGEGGEDGEGAAGGGLEVSEELSRGSNMWRLIVERVSGMAKCAGGVAES